MNPTLNPTKVVCLKPWRNSRWVHGGLEDLEINHGWRLETTMFSVQVPKNDQPIAIHFWMFMTTERCEGRSSQGHEPELGRANMYPVNYNDLTSRPSPGIMVKGNHPQMAELFRLVKYYNLPRDIIYIYICIYSVYIYIYIIFINIFFCKGRNIISMSIFSCEKLQTLSVLQMQPFGCLRGHLAWLSNVAEILHL